MTFSNCKGSERERQRRSVESSSILKKKVTCQSYIAYKYKPHFMYVQTQYISRCRKPGLCCVAMGIKKWLNPERTECIHLGQSRSYRMQSNSHNYRTQTLIRWNVFWKKIKRNKYPSSQVTLQAYYDPKNYSKNFDHGVMEPDNLSRSFSARFADPSRFCKMESLLDMDRCQEIAMKVIDHGVFFLFF